MLAEQHAADRRRDAHESALDVELVGTDQAVAVLLAALVFERHPGTEEDAVGIGHLAGAHDAHLVEALAQKSHAPIDLAQPLLAIDVLGVLRAVAEGRGVGDLLRDSGSLDGPQLLELGLELSRAFGGDGDGALRRQGIHLDSGLGEAPILPGRGPGVSGMAVITMRGWVRVQIEELLVRSFRGREYFNALERSSTRA